MHLSVKRDSLDILDINGTFGIHTCNILKYFFKLNSIMYMAIYNMNNIIYNLFYL